MKNSYQLLTLSLASILLGACASIPNGPSTMALPGNGKSFDQFQVDDQSCRGFALNQIGGATANQASNDSFAKTAVLGTALGAVVGAAAGGGRGAGVGAATGLAMGSVVGAAEADATGYSTQARYDNAYNQCMYAKGHQVAVSASMARRMTSTPVNSAPVYYVPPPPPPGYRP